MPIIKSAKKAERQSKNRRVLNQKKKEAVKAGFKTLKKEKNKEGLAKLFSLADKAAKTGVIHKNKAKRIKRQASAFLASLKTKKDSEKIKTQDKPNKK